MNNNGYQPAEQRTVVVVPYSNRFRSPFYLRQGVRVGGLALGMSCVVCLGMFGVFFLLSSTIMLATANYDDEFWEEFDEDVDPTVIVGSIFLVLGIIMVAAAVGVCLYARKKYKNFDRQGLTSPGRVINPNPGGYPEQPGAVGHPGYPQQAGYGQPQPVGYGQPQPAGYGQPQPAGYPGQPQPYGYPGQPQPYGYPGQPQATEQPLIAPEQTSFFPGPPAPYPQQAGGYAAQPDPPYPEKPGKLTVTSVTNEYVPPPPSVPVTSYVPSAPSSDPPPYQP